MYNNFYKEPIMTQNPEMMMQNPEMMMGQNDERFLFAPFILGGIAGTALGYGIANTNQGGNYYPVYPAYPAPYPYPVYSTNNYY